MFDGGSTPSGGDFVVVAGAPGGLFARRTSCMRMAANQFRILLSGLAYTVFEGLRRLSEEAQTNPFIRVPNALDVLVHRCNDQITPPFPCEQIHRIVLVDLKLLAICLVNPSPQAIGDDPACSPWPSTSWRLLALRSAYVVAVCRVIGTTSYPLC